MWTELFFFISHQAVPAQGSKKTMVTAQFLFFCPQGFRRLKKKELVEGHLVMQQSCGCVGVTSVWLMIYSENLEELIQNEIPYLLTLCGPAFISRMGDISGTIAATVERFCLSAPKNCGCDIKLLVPALYWTLSALKNCLSLDTCPYLMFYLSIVCMVHLYSPQP